MPGEDTSKVYIPLDNVVEIEKFAQAAADAAQVINMLGPPSLSRYKRKIRPPRLPSRLNSISTISKPSFAANWRRQFPYPADGLHPSYSWPQKQKKRAYAHFEC
jgi:hypothetical protein